MKDPAAPHRSQARGGTLQRGRSSTSPPPGGAAAGLPLAAAVLWSLFAAPKAKLSIPALAVVTKVAVQGGAVAALVVTGHPVLAAVLAAAVVLGHLLTMREEPPAAR